MNPQTQQRQPHAVLDLPSRNQKAMKIERLLSLAQRPQPMCTLEIGTGSGGIAQHRHLAEIRRVMKPNGIGYLAVPNRWMLTEPHYRLKFLSGWPHAWHTPYLRLMRKGTFYDCEPLRMRQLERMLAAVGFRYRNLFIEAWRETFEIERPHASATRWLRAMPNALLKPLWRIIPMLIYRIEHGIA